ncbi:uncharacterized protein CC84DRAFT_603299 [Paraphaeosphaeria sporulosa]|uniref:Uncharacterized protein n=1 Tax=Paraphaeosphaeria sporulosa TaxID=1460663 RepID=A0A177CQ54_9PLEO|nr:uncharacterized protein CC84DRAFT_603299 [Paraphaeosphaeria sporulosa]OAG09072.1 hypothetical protein CC84DRAFT_603299 [Paraphaeosphaeria sporulosa]
MEGRPVDRPRARALEKCRLELFVDGIERSLSCLAEVEEPLNGQLAPAALQVMKKASRVSSKSTIVEGWLLVMLYATLLCTTAAMVQFSAVEQKYEKLTIQRQLSHSFRVQRRKSVCGVRPRRQPMPVHLLLANRPHDSMDVHSAGIRPHPFISITAQLLTLFCELPRAFSMRYQRAAQRAEHTGLRGTPRLALLVVAEALQCWGRVAGATVIDADDVVVRL